MMEVLHWVSDNAILAIIILLVIAGTITETVKLWRRPIE